MNLYTVKPLDDLQKLNRTIAVYWVGNLNANQQAYLDNASTCVGLLLPSASEIAERLEVLRQNQHYRLKIGKLNRRYLRFARLGAKDAAAGKLDMLVRLGITLAQAKLLRDLTDDEVELLAFGWNHPIVGFASMAFERGTALHMHAGKHHATALVAANLSKRAHERS